MAYTPEMQELIKKVEATRPERLAKARKEDHYPPLTMAERDVVLSKFHPDYQEDGKRTVAVGPNKGDTRWARSLDSLSSPCCCWP